MKKPYVFISYSNKEADSANLVHSYLEGNGINCWIASRNIDGGESFAAQIVDAINDCAAFIVMASEASNGSNHVSNELSIAFGAKKKIIPFRLQDFQLSKENVYFLQQAQWIDAYENLNEALKKLLVAVRNTLPQDNIKIVPSRLEKKENSQTKEEEIDKSPILTRRELVNVLLKNMEKYPYCLKNRTRGVNYESFKALAKALFDKTLSLYYKGKITTGGLDYVDIIVDTLSQGMGVCMQIKGLPGCAKNMLVQLAYYKMLERFAAGESDYLPLYLSSSYYEKLKYSPEKAKEEMTELIKKDTEDFTRFVKRNPEVHPVLMVEAVREHYVSRFAPEDVISELWQRYGKFNRIIAIDVGLIKKRSRIKKTIALVGDGMGYSFTFRSVPITDRGSCMKVIETVLEMYSEQYESIDASKVYNVLSKLRFPTLDIFIVRLVATELAMGHSVEDISLTDMYERLALNEFDGDDLKILETSKELYEYIFDDNKNVRTAQYKARLWSLPHKHNTYLEFLIAYYFGNEIMHAEESRDYDFLRISMTSMENRFVSSRLADNYQLQESLLRIITENYESLDERQKSNAAYWLGKLTYADLADSARKLLVSEFNRLKSMVKNDNSQTLENRYRQSLFRSVCNGLISAGKTGVLDDYLCLVVTNDVANAINRGMVMEYMGDNWQASAHNDFALDSNPNVGEQTIRILCSRVESALKDKKSGYVEKDLVSLLTIVQARMHTTPEKLSYNLTPICEKCMELLEEYRTRPRNIVSDKLLYYFESAEEDMRVYADNPRFDAAFTIFTELSKLKDVKRTQWLEFGIEDPESVFEHTMSAWVLAMAFLPEVYSAEGYSKQEIMDMLMVHDMAEAILGDRVGELSAPTKELKAQNAVLRRLFLKGTYPEGANMTKYYNVWTGYYNAKNINARIARDINLIQTVNTFFATFEKKPENFSREMVELWLAKSNKLSTDIGYDLFERIISHNWLYRKSIDKKIYGIST